jgi:hypothetical protein
MVVTTVIDITGELQGVAETVNGDCLIGLSTVSVVPLAGYSDVVQNVNEITVLRIGDSILQFSSRINAD